MTADGAGHFKATLATGGWLVYTRRTDGQLLQLSHIDISAERTSQVKLTSR